MGKLDLKSAGGDAEALGVSYRRSVLRGISRASNDSVVFTNHYSLLRFRVFTCQFRAPSRIALL